MANAIKRIGVLTSGGDAPGMNAALRAVVRSCEYYNIKCTAIRNGYQGLIEEDLIEMGARSVKNIINRGGTIIKTARSEEFRTIEGRVKAANALKKNNIDALVVIGGDGSFTGGLKLFQEHQIPFIGVPGTIDNDIFGTDFTIGYDTALNTALSCIDKIRDTATSHNRVFFIEVMGRDAGFIALNTGIASGAQDILIPEQKDSIEELFSSLERSQERGKSSSIVVVSEGEELANVYDLAKATKEKFPSYDIRVTVLGHIQRGGDPSCSDRVLASRLGLAAVEGLLNGENAVMAGIQSGKVVFTPIEEAIKKHNEIDVELLKVAEILAI
jgi:6-phosphofructokinase 1